MSSRRSYRAVRVVRFADFELDVRAAELRKSGVRVRPQEQPFRLLAMLLEHPGEVVLRDEIRRRLWPNDTVVEVSHGIKCRGIAASGSARAETERKPTRVTWCSPDLDRCEPSHLIRQP